MGSYALCNDREYLIENLRGNEVALNSLLELVSGDGDQHIKEAATHALALYYKDAPMPDVEDVQMPDVENAAAASASSSNETIVAEEPHVVTPDTTYTLSPQLMDLVVRIQSNVPPALQHRVPKWCVANSEMWKYFESVAQIVF